MNHPKKCKNLALVFVFLLSGIPLFSQTTTEGVGISYTPVSPDPSAMLDVSATDKGILIPRITLQSTSDILTIPNPAKSLLIYNTNETLAITPGYYYWDGTIWKSFGPAKHEEWKVIGTAGTMDNGQPIPGFSYSLHQMVPGSGGEYDFKRLAIRKRYDGYVEIQGIYIQGPSGGSGSVNTLFQLPIGYRPSSNRNGVCGYTTNSCHEIQIPVIAVSGQTVSTNASFTDCDGTEIYVYAVFEAAP